MIVDYFYAIQYVEEAKSASDLIQAIQSKDMVTLMNDYSLNEGQVEDVLKFIYTQPHNAHSVALQVVMLNENL